MNLLEFQNLPSYEQKLHLSIHEHLMGEERWRRGDYNMSPIGQGPTALDFHVRILKEDGKNCNKVILKLKKPVNHPVPYKHCCKCEDLFENKLSEEDRIDPLPKSDLKGPFNYIEISDSLCDSCWEYYNNFHNYRKIFRELGLTS